MFRSGGDIPGGWATIFAAVLGGIFLIIAALISNGNTNSNTPKLTASPIATAHSTTNNPIIFTETEELSATNTLIEVPTNPPPPPTLTEQEKAIQLAQSGVNANNNWLPYTEKINGVEMVLVPKGCFMMGSVDGQPDERPVYEQCFDVPFWIDETEVTRGMYQECVEAGVCEVKPSNPYSSRRDQPINYVSWFDAKDYCEWRGARLPTEREWEYAARGPDNLIYPWGDDFVAENLVYQKNSNNMAASVGSRLEGVSWVGAMDMSGNVFEWVSSIYNRYPYTEGWEDYSDTKSDRGMRGSSYYSSENYVPTTWRDYRQPITQMNSLGFRCARDFE